LKFEFARYLAVYRGIPRHTAIPLGGGKNPAVGKKNPGCICAGSRLIKHPCASSDRSDGSMHACMHACRPLAICACVPSVHDARIGHRSAAAAVQSMQQVVHAIAIAIAVTGTQYFSLRTNQPLSTTQQYFYLRTNQHRPSATSQTNRPRSELGRCLRSTLSSQVRRRSIANHTTQYTMQAN
jgi:hypothetical protein